ncbi:GatB/YqeY domain-containing protein [Candidatus Parcubacteria bacterium]|nr:GatB/YqeY domain-containing protein [Candidatus Parcubacteria bacterium]
MIQKQIRDEMKSAMLSKDANRLSVLRGLIAAFTNELVAKGKKPSEEITDDDALNVIRRSVKQRKDSIDQFRAGNREDLAKQEELELTILQTYLPKTMSQDEIRKIAEKKKDELKADKSKLGILMGAVMKELKGKADGADVKAVVEQMFS